jgi:hypothetical protein
MGKQLNFGNQVGLMGGHPGILRLTFISLLGGKIGQWQMIFRTTIGLGEFGE